MLVYRYENPPGYVCDRLDNAYSTKIRLRQWQRFFLCSQFLCNIQRNSSELILKLLGTKYFSMEQLPIDSFIIYVNKRIMFQLINKSLFSNLSSSHFQQEFLTPSPHPSSSDYSHFWKILPLPSFMKGEGIWTVSIIGQRKVFYKQRIQSLAVQGNKLLTWISR